MIKGRVAPDIISNCWDTEYLVDPLFTGHYSVNGKDVPDIEFAGYPAILKAGYRISGRISG